MLNNKISSKKEKTKIILNIDKDQKEVFKSICEKNKLTMTEVLAYTIKVINDKKEINSVDYRAE